MTTVLLPIFSSSKKCKIQIPAPFSLHVNLPQSAASVADNFRVLRQGTQTCHYLLPFLICQVRALVHHKINGLSPLTDALGAKGRTNSRLVMAAGALGIDERSTYCIGRDFTDVFSPRAGSNKYDEHDYYIQISFHFFPADFIISHLAFK
jgi:hypothetical protein